MQRIIFHVDMDAFYASVEQRDEPRYREQPVVVGSDPQGGRGRGVVAACSYQARQFGIHSAMPISQCYRACPQAVYLRPDFPKYTRVSRAIRKIFYRFSSQVEPISIDEAFLDVSKQAASASQALELGARLKREIYQLQHLTASIGIAPCKLVAKIASDWKKPDGLFLVRSGQVQEFLDPLPVSRIWGVGPKTQERLEKMDVRTIQELRSIEQDDLQKRLGKFGRQLWFLARGIDERPVRSQPREAKSISQERTFAEDVDDDQVLEDTLEQLCLKVAQRLSKSGLTGKTTTLKLRYSDFTTITRQVSSRFPTCSAQEIQSTAFTLLRRHRAPGRRIRLIGIGLSNLEPENQETPRQLRLF
ncbi:MAG: DNA polymerase IV [Acidobacteriota bacterium]